MSESDLSNNPDEVKEKTSQDIELKVNEETKQPVLSNTDEDQLIGLTIDDKYRIEEKIGSGGLGVVYKAKHLIAETTVALKVLLPGKQLDKTTIERFRREARTAMALKHPNIAGVQDIGAHGKMPFLIMEYVEGKPLNELLEEGSLSTAQKTSIIKQVLEALEYARGKGVVHRDLKPSNIVIKNDNHAKLIDFGIAKVIDEKDKLTLTNTGDFFGTPSYMSPEQCKGEATDFRTDIYGTGCIAYELYSGSPPYQSDGILAVLNAHVHDDIPKLKAPEDLKGIEIVITKALAKQKKDRFSSAKQMLEEIERVEKGMKPKYALKTLSQKRVKTLFQIAIVFSTILLLSYLWFIKTFTVTTIESRTQELIKNPQNVNALIDRGRLYTENKQYRYALSDLKKAVDLAPDNSGALIRKGIAEKYLGEYSQALKDITKGIDLFPTNYRGYLERACVLQDMGKFNKAISDYKKAIELNQINHANNNSVAYNNLAELYYRQNEFGKAIKAANESLSLNKKLPQNYLNRAASYLAINNPDKCIEDCSTALTLNAKYAPAFYNRALGYNETGKYKLALKDADELLLLDPNNAQAYEIRAKVFKNLKQWEKAKSNIDKALSFKVTPDFLALKKEIERELKKQLGGTNNNTNYAEKIKPST